ncbi:putative ribosome-binding factor A, mitochondrial isoform X2 [Amblyomma americanum]
MDFEHKTDSLLRIKRHPQQYVYSAPNSAVPSAPRKVQERTRRQRVLNAVFMENISNIMVTGDISEKLRGCAVQLTQVRISADCTHLNVYWVTSLQEHGADERVAELLQSNAGFLKSELIKSGFIGKAPKITFVKDVTYGRGAEVERLIDKIGADIPPDLDLPESTDEQFLDSESATESVSTSAADVPSRPYVPSDMKVDIYGLDRAAIMRQVLLKTKGLGRTPLEEPTFLKPGTENLQETQARMLSLAEYVQQRKLKSRLQIKAEREAQRSLSGVQGNLDEKHTLENASYPEVDYEVDIDEEVEDLSNVSFLDEQER